MLPNLDIISRCKNRNVHISLVFLILVKHILDIKFFVVKFIKQSPILDVRHLVIFKFVTQQRSCYLQLYVIHI